MTGCCAQTGSSVTSAKNVPRFSTKPTPLAATNSSHCRNRLPLPRPAKVQARFSAHVVVTART